VSILETAFVILLAIIAFVSIYHSSRKRRREQLRGFEVKPPAKDEHQL
jgi:hypothetical protein